MSDKCLDCQSGVARMRPSERENHAQKASDSSSNYISVIIHTLLCCCLFDSNETNIGSDGKDAAITSYYNAFPAVRSAVCSSYSPKVPFTTRKTSSGYSDTVRGYGTKVQRRLHKKERERGKETSQQKEREKPSCVQTSLMKTTRNPPSSSLQNSEAELAFCGDIILTPRFSSR